MYKKPGLAAMLLAALLPTLAVAAPLSIEQAMDLAVQRSEAARSARAGARGAAEMARTAAQLPDPMLSVGIDNLPVTGSNRFSTVAEEMTMKRIGLAQEWVPADKRRAREAAAQAAVAREFVMENIAAAEARLQSALAYVDAYFASQALRLARQNESNAREELETGKGRLATASGNAAEVLALSGLVGMSQDESGELLQQQAAASAVLQRWVGLVPDEFLPPAVPALPSEPQYVAMHPAVVARLRDIEVARREVESARLNRRPNWTWEVSYGQRQGYADVVSFGVSLPLPIAPSARQDRETAARLALADKAEAEAAEAQRSAQGEFAALTSDARRLQERIERFRSGVIVPAQQRVTATLAAYKSNQAGLAMLFEARRAELDAQRKLLSLQRELAKAQAQLAFKPIVGAAP